jgi:hypothetical protein
MARIDQESTSSMYFICSPAEKLRLNMLKMRKVVSTSFSRYLAIR